MGTVTSAETLNTVFFLFFFPCFVLYKLASQFFTSFLETGV